MSCALLLVACAANQSSTVVVDTDGGMLVPAFRYPPSDIASAEMNASRVEHITTERTLKTLPVPELNRELFGKRVSRVRALYDVVVEDSVIADVPVRLYRPRKGIATETREVLLINLHGGGFRGCFSECGALESIPVAAVFGSLVISIDYREGPDSKFPAASEDVAKVYGKLLESTRPENIGIFGCSAGGILTAQSLAWFQEHDLPAPGAAGIFCAGGSAKLAGDSAFTGLILGDGELPAVAAPGSSSRNRIGYFSDADLEDPLVSPALHTDTLGRFPPTLIINGTRDFMLSPAIQLHRSLVSQGVQTEFQMWEGGRHAFFYDPDIPESAEVHRVIANFFHHHLLDTQ